MVLTREEVEALLGEIGKTYIRSETVRGLVKAGYERISDTVEDGAGSE